MRQLHAQIAEQRIIGALETDFTAELGPAKAFFELPQREGDPVRVIYVTYAIQGEDLQDVENWFFEHVIDVLREKTGGDGYLYWRNPERVLVYPVTTKTLTSGAQVTRDPVIYKIRTRFAVLDKFLNPIVAPEYKPEGALTPEIITP